VGKQGRRILSVEAGYHYEFCARRRRGEFSAGLKTRIKILEEIFSTFNQQRRA
jgi:ABC-type Na+ transport system ATPase subunit NatA